MKRKNRRQVKDENEFYSIEVEDWQISSSFHVNQDPRRLIHPGDYVEDSTITLLGKVVMPAMKETSRSVIRIKEITTRDDHWKDQGKGDPGASVGYIQIVQDADKTLEVTCSVPSRSFLSIAIGAAAGKIKLASIWCSKLKHRWGLVSGIDLATRPEE